MMNIILGYLLAVNITSFLLYGIDKYKAKKDNRQQAESNIKLALNIAEARLLTTVKMQRKTIVKWRISEATLLMIAVIGGSIGAWGGMRLWHHKTMHREFQHDIPVIIIMQICLVVYLHTIL